MHLPRRFDGATMSPPDPSQPVSAALLAAVRAWCEGGAFPVLVEPLRVASIAPHGGLDGAACVLDGSHELARLGRWGGLRWRAQILWKDVMARGNGLGVPWDCGWWREGSLGPAKAFQPRRATLLMVRDPEPAVAAELLSTLRARSQTYTRPVRVLVVSAAGMAGIERL